jgi:hypothetical protein
MSKILKMFKPLSKQENLLQDVEFVYLKTINHKVDRQGILQKNLISNIKKQQNK